MTRTSPTRGRPAFDRGLPLNFVACSALLERLAREQPERLAALRQRLSERRRGGVRRPVPRTRGRPAAARIADCGTCSRGEQVHQELLGQEVRVFARKRFGFHPQLPLLLQNVGITRAVLVAFDEAVLPSHRSPVVSWPSPDGKQVEAFTRTPHPADSAQTYFHLTYHLHQTIMQDQAATLALLHRDKAGVSVVRRLAGAEPASPRCWAGGRRCRITSTR